MSEAKNDERMLKTKVALEQPYQELIPEEYHYCRKELSSRYRLVFFEDKIIVPTGLRTTVITLLHKGQPAINKMTNAVRSFWWPRMGEAIQKKCETCAPCRMSGKNIKPNLPSTEGNQRPKLSEPAASCCKTIDGSAAVRVLKQCVNLNSIPNLIRSDKAIAFTGELSRNFCIEKFISLVYGTPYKQFDSSVEHH